jgi:hypothetical protein
MMQEIMWEPCNRQHILHAYTVIAKESYAKAITMEELYIIFLKESKMVYNELKMIFEMPKRQNDFQTLVQVHGEH